MDRPYSAVGTFLRILTVNDSYTLANIPHLASAIKIAKAQAERLNCVVTTHMNGDFIGPCTLSSLDGGKAMIEALNVAGIDYACLGNHEFDIGVSNLNEKLQIFKGTLINSNMTHPTLAHFPKWDCIDVGDKRVLITGHLTEDMSIFAPGIGIDGFIKPLTKSCFDVWEEATQALGEMPDLFLPMTHQSTVRDKATAAALGNRSDLKDRTPVILGGHDHEVYVDEAGSSLIVKVGMDCAKIGFVDIWWTEDDKIAYNFAMKPAIEFPKDPGANWFCQKQMDFLESIMDCPIMWLDRPMSSKLVRYEPSDMATLLLSILKRAFKKEGVEIVMIQGGAVRAGKEYSVGPFRVLDLFKELAFDCQQAIVPIKGSIIAESIKNSRSGPFPAPDFLHCDDEVEIDAEDEHIIVSINGKPFDPEHEYTVSIYLFLLNGLNVIEPLASYARKHLRLPPMDVCRGAKDIIISTLINEAWLEALGVPKQNGHGNGHIDAADIKARMDKTFLAMDKDNDGMIDKVELGQYLEGCSINGVSVTPALLSKMIDSIDVDRNGKITRVELDQICHASTKL